MRRRLILLALAITSLVVIALVVPLCLLVRDQAETRALARAQRTAQSVAAGLAVAESLEEGVSPAVAAFVIALTGDDLTSVHLADGTIVGEPTSSPNVAIASTGRAFTAAVDGGAEVLVPVTTDGPAHVVVTFVPDEALRRGVTAAWIALGSLGLVLIGVAVAVADRLGRSLVRPVEELSGAALRMAGGDLTARVEPAGPAEIAAAGGAFNHLADRLDDLIAAERESIADLSHRLRTPLTSLRLQVEMLSDQAESGPLISDLDRLTEQVNGLIAEARRRSPSTGPRRGDLAAATRHLLAFWQVLADEQERSVASSIPEQPVEVRLTENELTAAVEAILENVFAHTPEGTALSVTVTAREGGPALVVDDDGPGFPGADMVDRGASGTGSTGLGLDIARRAAERSGGSLQIGRSPSGGARVELRFGAAEP